MVVGAMAVSPTAVPGRTDPPPPKAEPVISSGPKAWALATTAHLTYRNGWRIDMLAPKYRTDSTLAETRQILRDWCEHNSKRRRNSLVGWDYCRYIMLCRCGYQVGFLSEEEAWGRIMPMARAIQAAFPSWSELGEDYLVGREFWSIAETKKSGQYFRELEA